MTGTRQINRLPRAIAALVAGMSLLWAAALHAAEEERVEAFLNVTGFDVALDSISLTAEDAATMLGLEPGSFDDEWDRIAKDVFDTALMRDTAVTIMQETLSDEDLAHAAAFYASPLGQRLVEVENAAHTAPDTQKQEQGESLVAAMVERGDERLGVLRDLSAAVDESGVAVRAVQEIQVRFLMAASNAGLLERELDEGALRAMMRETENELRLSMKQSALANAAYTYRDISDEDLRAYLDALRQPRMQRVYELMNAVQWEIMGDRYAAMARRVGAVAGGQEL